MVVYLDDFLMVHRNADRCRSQQIYLLEVLDRLGFNINWQKVVLPKNQIDFLGYKLDSVQQRVFLPGDKLQSLSNLAESFAARSKICKQDLHIILGHMCFAARAIYGARCFFRIFLDELCKLKHPAHRTRVTKLLQAELKWWQSVAPRMNGLCMNLFSMPRPSVTVTSGASFKGFGAVPEKSFSLGTWIENPGFSRGGLANNWVFSPALGSTFVQNLNFLELVAAILSLLIRASLLAGSIVFVNCDNTSTVSF